MRSALLAALCVPLLSFAGCTSAPVTPEQVIREQADAMRAALTKVIVEPARRAELLECVDRLEHVLQEQNRDLARLAHELETMNADHAAPRARFEDEFVRFRERVNARFDRVQELHFEMVRAMDAEEWKRVVDLEHKAIEAATSADVEVIQGGRS
jgi:hypothetical protein